MSHDESSPRSETTTDTGHAPAPVFDRAVTKLRLWGTDTVFPLPLPGVDTYVIGSDATATLRLTDDAGQISRRHARIFRTADGWRIEDLGSKNGLREHGVRRTAFDLTAGTEIGIGKLTLVAESLHHALLRGYLARVIGWADRGQQVDLARRTLQQMMTAQQPVLLVGDSDLVPVARQLHRRTYGPEAPFVVCGDQLAELDADDEPTSLAAAHTSLVAALAAGRGGTVCVRAGRLPDDFIEGVAIARSPDVQASVLACARRRGTALTQIAVTIDIPSLADRTAELSRVVWEYALDAADALHVPPGFATIADREWIVAQRPTSFADIETMTMRAVAIRATGSPYRAAPQLGISHSGLLKWIRRSGFPL